MKIVENSEAISWSRCLLARREMGAMPYSRNIFDDMPWFVIRTCALSVAFPFLVYDCSRCVEFSTFFHGVYDNTTFLATPA